MNYVHLRFPVAGVVITEQYWLCLFVVLAVFYFLFCIVLDNFKTVACDSTKRLTNTVCQLLFFFDHLESLVCTIKLQKWSALVSKNPVKSRKLCVAKYHPFKLSRKFHLIRSVYSVRPSVWNYYQPLKEYRKMEGKHGSVRYLTFTLRREQKNVRFHSDLRFLNASRCLMSDLTHNKQI